MENLDSLKKEINKIANPEKAKLLMRFFKTGKGEYGEGDIFIGLMVPQQRRLAKQYSMLTLPEMQELLNSKIHEHRLIALFILITKYKKSSEQEKEKVFNFYIKNTKNINNWDLIDLSAPNIVGDFIFNRDRSIIYKLSASHSLWEKRISILSTFTFIKYGDFKDSLEIAKILLKDKHDLIHKAIGWMLREIGKKDVSVLEKFLQENYSELPRTTLRYAIERFPEKKRKAYLNGEFNH